MTGDVSACSEKRCPNIFHLQRKRSRHDYCSCGETWHRRLMSVLSVNSVGRTNHASRSHYHELGYIQWQVIARIISQQQKEQRDAQHGYPEGYRQMLPLIEVCQVRMRIGYILNITATRPTPHLGRKILRVVVL